MTRLVFRLAAEALLGGFFLWLGIWFVGYREAAPFADAVPAWVGWILIAIAALIFAHVSIRAASGRVRTPEDAGAGFRVPGTPRRQKPENGPRDLRR